MPYKRIQESRCIFDVITSNFPIMCRSYVAWIVLTTVFSMAWYKIVILFWYTMAYPLLSVYHAIENTANQNAGKPLYIQWYYIQSSHHVLLIHVCHIIIHQTHYEKSDWSRAFNQFTIACGLDMINILSAADNAFIMSSSTSAWLLSPLECSPQKQNG